MYKMNTFFPENAGWWNKSWGSKIYACFFLKNFHSELLKIGTTIVLTVGFADVYNHSDALKNKYAFCYLYQFYIIEFCFSFCFMIIGVLSWSLFIKDRRKQENYWRNKHCSTNFTTEIPNLRFGKNFTAISHNLSMKNHAEMTFR